MSSDPSFDRLLQDCTTKSNPKSCLTLAVYAAVTNIHARLERELDLGIKIPSPIPHEHLKTVLGDGATSRGPSEFVPMKVALDDSRRIQVIDGLRASLVKIAGELEVELNNVKLRAGKG